MKLLYAFGGVLIAGFSMMAFSQTSTSVLILKVENIKKEKGSIVIGLVNKKEDFQTKNKPYQLVKAPVKGDTAIYTFQNIPKGDFYAASIYQDMNDNDKLDANFIGMPKEPYAFSNSALGEYGRPPTYEQARFSVQQDTVVKTIRFK